MADLTPLIRTDLLETFMRLSVLLSVPFGPGVQ